MESPQSTCWTVIRAAGEGNADARELFARCYVPVVRAYLGQRWRGTRHLGDLEDAVQEVFVECFKEGGALERTQPDRPGGFRAFLYGIVRNVARRIEARLAGRRERAENLEDEEVHARDLSLSQAFDRAWAGSVLREAARVQAERATSDAKKRRHRILELRFQENLPIREIARRWDADAAELHADYRRARQEFRQALEEVLTFHSPGARVEVRQEVDKLLSILR